MRRGFTLVETLVALVLLEIGMLALAATSAVAARDFAVASRTTRAESLGRNHRELLAANACTASAGAAEVAGGYGVTWSVHAAARRRTLSVSVGFDMPGGQRRFITLRTAALCS